MRCEQVVFFSPTLVPIFHVFFAVFLKLTHLLNDFESKPNEILTHFAPTDILAEITKCWHLPWGEFHPFSTFGPIWTLGVSGSLWGSVCKSGETLGSQDGTRWSQDGQRWRQTDRPSDRPTVRPTDRPSDPPTVRPTVRPPDRLYTLTPDQPALLARY